MTAANITLTRQWLARSFRTLAPALRDLAGTPWTAGGPTPPTSEELLRAASVIERTADCLHHVALGAGV